MITSIRIVSLLCLLLLTGCVTRTEYVMPVLDVPPHPWLPSVQAHELLCVSDETGRKLVVREELLRGYAREMRATLEAHNTIARGEGK